MGMMENGGAGTDRHGQQAQDPTEKYVASVPAARTEGSDRERRCP
ncbi:MAG: hypothetical protein WA133_14385 [Syntrophales bacterium]